jgi:hypothetical protein
MWAAPSASAYGDGWSLGADGNWTYSASGQSVSSVSLASGASGDGGGFGSASSFSQLVADAQAGTATPEEMSALEGVFDSIAEATGTQPFTADPTYGGADHSSWVSPNQWNAVFDATQGAEVPTGSVAQAVSGEAVDAATTEGVVGDLGPEVTGACIDTAGAACLGAGIVGVYAVVGIELYQLFSSDGNLQPSGTLAAPTAVVREYLPRVHFASWSNTNVDLCSSASRGGAKTVWSLNDWTNNFGAMPVPSGGNMNNGRAGWAPNSPLSQEVVPCSLRGVYVWEPEFASHQWDTADFAYVSGSKTNWAGGTCSRNGTTNPDVPFPTGGSFSSHGWVNVASTAIGCTDGASTADTGEVQLSLQPPSALKMTAPTTGSCSSVSSPCVTDPAAPASSWCTSGGSSMTEQVLGNCLAQLLAPQYGDLVQHYNHVLDLPVLEGNGPQTEPTDPGTVAVPTLSAGETWSQYESDLDNAGFTSVNRQILTSDTADLDQPASAVTLLSPAPGQYADTAATMTVTTNPDSPNMPQATAREISLADLLQTQNLGITNENKLKIARTCLELEDAATGNADTTGDSGDVSFYNCSTLPIFITGYDAQSAGQHDEIALGDPSVTTDPSLTFSDAYGGINPTWVLLSRDVTGKPGTWKYSLPPCNSGLPQPGAQCDEYPFLSTQQGGGGVSPQPNLQYISGAQNGLQGTRLGQFYSAATPTSQGINGCNITYGTQFLAIPVANYLDTYTTWGCNGRNP